jgi:hypothetical protein
MQIFRKINAMSLNLDQKRGRSSIVMGMTIELRPLSYAKVLFSSRGTALKSSLTD